MFQRLKADRQIGRELHAVARGGVITKRQVLAVASAAESRGDRRGAAGLRAWMDGYSPDSRHRLLS